MSYVKKKKEVLTPLQCFICKEKMRGYEVLLGAICSKCFKQKLS